MNRKVNNSLFAMTFTVVLFCSFISVFSLPRRSMAQNAWQRMAEQPETLGLDQGFVAFETPVFDIRLVGASQTIAALQPKGEGDFDFTPSDHLEVRSRNNLYHLGDLTFRLRIGEARDWKKYSSAADRAPVIDLGAGGRVLASSDMAPTFPEDLPLQVHRFWETEKGDLVLRFELTNTSVHPVEIGSLGIPLIFNNLLHNKSLDQSHAECVFSDPYIGQDAGYLQVIRLHGHGPVLLVLPYGDTPFEAYNPLLDDPTPKGVTFEGFHEWMAHSRAHAEEDWSEAEPWNRPTSVRLNPGESRSYGLKFITTESPRTIEPALIAHERPVAVGIPGYVLPKDVNARLFLKYPAEVRSLDVEPAGALLISKGEPTPNGWKTYHINGLEWGRARLTVTYADGLKQTINYNVIKSEEKVVTDMGRFLTTEQWYENPDDLYLLRVGHAGVMGGIANITREGFSPAAFHSYPSTLRIDGINGDYGPGFLGYTLNTGTYVKYDEEFGWLSFSGELEDDGDWIFVTPTNADRSRVFIADLGLWLTLDAGKFEQVAFNPASGQVRIFLDPATAHTAKALLRIEQPAAVQGIGTYSPEGALSSERGAYVILLRATPTRFELVHR